MANDGQGRNHSFSQKLRNLAYQAAFQHCHQEILAEEAAHHTLQQVSRKETWFSGQTPLDQKGFIGLVATYYALKDKAEETPVEDGEKEESEELEKADPDKLISTYQMALQEMPAREKALFLLAVHFRLSDEEIAKLVAQSTGQISREIERISEQLSNRVQDDEVEPTLRRTSMQKACAFQVKSLVDRLEAFASLNEHTFSLDVVPDPQAPVYRPVDRPVSRQDHPQRREKGRGDSPSNWTFPPKAKSASSSRFKDQTKVATKSAYYISGILAILVLLVLARFTILKPKDQGRLASSDQSSISEEAVQSSSEEAPVTRETRPVPSRYYGAYDNTILFVDPENNTVFECPKGGEVKKILNIDEAASQHGGIHHVGKVDDTIYLAFMDGKAGHISGEPAELTLEPYWQKAWFEGQLEGQPRLDEPLIYDGVAYQFEEKED